jgi:cellulose synthase/poly-beta-1,6-N-acetylglucosamine synthase-like glycosyltransferase/exo-beta-1,3-glucanase (GH17 family)
MRLTFLAIIAALCVHAGLWVIGRETVSAPQTSQKFNSLSFAPHGKNERPDKGDLVKPEQIRNDIKAIAPYTKAIRTYAATGGLEQVPAIAGEYNMPVTQGIWIDKDEARNALEIRNGLEIAAKNPNVKSLVVGNEVMLRNEKTPEEMIALLRSIKEQTSLPITTGEVWHVWLKYPELASAVDYIAVHILPYWEGHSGTIALDHTLILYERLRRAFPGKHIVIAEFGWPSGGYNLKGADPGPLEQARVIREFMSRASARGIDYNIVEAIDQPWKIFEGSVGPYWGMFDADRRLKFPLSGEIVKRTWFERAILALIAGFLLSLPIFALKRPRFAQVFVLSAAANAVGAWFGVLVDYWLTHYFVLGAQIAMIIGTIFLLPLAVVLLSRIDEIASILFGRPPEKLLKPALDLEKRTHFPKVSIHIPAYREPPDMLKKTLDSIAQLNYPDFECVVAINNTPDPADWQPIEDYCKILGERFVFLNLQNLAGFKAGALRVAIEHTAADAEIIGVIDADYVVHPDWLREVVPAFDDPQVGLVQAPQDHRDANRSPLHNFMNTEYAGFFDIGMVQRNENNAIIVHGTMCLIRRSAMEEAGGWSSDTICEDSDLGLSILMNGKIADYTRKRYGWGLLPDSYEAFRKQRHRWAFGGVQIAMKHLKSFFGRNARLMSAQRNTYLIGWINWMGAETLGVAIAILNLLWVPVVAFGGIAIPEMVLTFPVLIGFAVYLLHFFTLYTVRVKHPVKATLGAAVTAMALQLTVARAVTEGVVKQHMPFIRTAKGGSTAALSFPAFWEAVLAGLLILGSITLFITNTDQVYEINLFAIVLLVQAMPFLAAVLVTLFERSPFNQPVAARSVWRQLVRGIFEKTSVPNPVSEADKASLP